MNTFVTLLHRGFGLRCPVCGKGYLFKSPFKMNKQCPYCGLIYERESGYFTGAMAINLVISELLVTAFVVPMSANLSIPLYITFLIGAPLPVLLPLIFFHHSRGLWLAMNHYFSPQERE